MDARGKENAPPQRRRPHPNDAAIAGEPRNRITCSFRASKTFSARKRPFCELTPPLGCRSHSPISDHLGKSQSAAFRTPLAGNGDADAFGEAKAKQLQTPPVRKLPLSEVRVNHWSPNFDLFDIQRGGSCRSTLGELEQSGARSSEEFGTDGLVAPVAELPGCSFLGSCREENPPSSALVEDEFDESLLREIDELCEQRSAVKDARSHCQCAGQDASCPVTVLSDEKELIHGKNDAVFAGEGGLHVENVPSDNKDLVPGDTNALAHDSSGGEKSHSSQDSGSSSVPQAYLDYWKKLNEKQRDAACSDIAVPLMIVAGPGSGKTSTMVGRVLMLLKERIQPSNILAMTFTTAAASEMRDRIGAVVGKSIAKELSISTFHSFCLQLCRLHAEKLGRTTEFLVYGHGQQRRAIIEALRLIENQKKDRKDIENISSGCSIQSFKDKSKKWEKFVAQAKASGKTPDEYRKMGDEFGAAVLGNYDDILKLCNALDYHDFISCSVKLLTDFPEVYQECQESWKAVVVDEFQDTSSMQYNLLRLLASHSRLTVIGDEDQSIFSFNGADICGFDSFRKDFPKHKEIRLTVNYRSTRCIVEAASSLIHNNLKRCHSKQVETDNSTGCKITVKECPSESAQCAYVVDKILEIVSDNSVANNTFGDIAILYRRQVTGKAFQSSLRDRKIPFNVHGVAFYRKKVIRAVIAILRTTLPDCGDAPFRQSFKALLLGEKEEKKKVIEYIEKISAARKISFFTAASDIYRAKVSGTFKRAQLSDGRKVLNTLDMLSKLVEREQSISAVITSAAAVIPQKYLLEKRAAIDVDGGKYLNEDNDFRSVLQYLSDDVSEFLSTHFNNEVSETDRNVRAKGCAYILKAFLDHISMREAENFQVRKRDNGCSVTLTTIHQSKGLEWDTVFIVKVNESEIPLLHEFNGTAKEGGATLEEERRLLYVAMTRGRKKLYILYVIMDSNWQLLQPSRFLKELPANVVEDKADKEGVQAEEIAPNCLDKTSECVAETSACKSLCKMVDEHCHSDKDNHAFSDGDGAIIYSEACFSNDFLKGFNVENRAIISHMFHQWAKKSAFQNPRRLLDKVGFVIDERLRSKTCKSKDLLRALKASLRSDDAFQYARQVLHWEQIPFDQRAHLMREKQEHFQKQRVEISMGSSEATAKQIAYLQMLGCTIVPSSRLHASRLIEQYKSV